MTNSTKAYQSWQNKQQIAVGQLSLLDQLVGQTRRDTARSWSYFALPPPNRVALGASLYVTLKRHLEE